MRTVPAGHEGAAALEDAAVDGAAGGRLASSARARRVKRAKATVG